jgi:paraquat-inducible protein B
MTEPGLPPPEDWPVAEPAARRRFSLSIVWLVPLLAALIGGWLAVNAILLSGPTITIQFSSGEGLEAGKTRIKYKDVDIGNVTAVTLTPDRGHIQVTAKLVREAAPCLVQDSRFWVVRPRITGGTVSGLGTLLTGAYIAMDAGHSLTSREHFIGLDEVPSITGNLPGRQFTLLAEDLGSLVIGSPVLYRRVPVGQVVAYKLMPDGQNVSVSIFVNRPYDRFVTINSRFWHASGIDVTLDANGLKVDTQSLASIALGGVAFDTPDLGTEKEPLSNDHLFLLARDHDQATRRLEPDGRSFLVLFNESLRGLTVGAPVDYRGIVIGEVSAIGLDADPDTHDLQMAVRVQVYPGRLLALAGEKQTRETVEQLSLRRAVARGLRAQLRSANLLTGQLYVALDFYPHAPRALVSTHDGLMVLPSIPGDLGQLQQTLTRIVNRIDRMPLDQIGVDARHSLKTLDATLQNANQLVSGLNGRALPQTLKTLQDLQQTLAVARQSLQPDSPLQEDLRDAAQQVSAAARSVQSLSDSLERHPEALIRGNPGDRQ